MYNAPAQADHYLTALSVQAALQSAFDALYSIQLQNCDFEKVLYFSIPEYFMYTAR